MGGELERRWDEAVETAWREFRQRLADRLAGLAEDESLIVEVSDGGGDGVAPYCQAIAGEGWLRVEAVSNVYLADRHELDDEQCEAVKGLGFTAPDEVDPMQGETNFWADLEQREADRAAVMMVRALREVYGVLHPVYLDAGGLEPEGAAHPSPPEPRLDEPIRPEGPDQVRAGVGLAVKGLFDSDPEWDEDGDLPLPTSRGVVWVYVSGTAARILLHAPLVEDVADEQRALVEVNLLNQKEFGLTFVVRDGRISVSRELDVAVLVPAQVRVEAERLTSQVDGWAADLVARVGGRCMDETTPRRAPGHAQESADEGRFEAAYAVLLELEKQERGSVDPAAMARVFQQDTGLLMKAIRVTEGRLRDWQRRERTYVADGKVVGVKLARARQQVHRDLRSRMRQALRLIVDAPVRKVQLDQLALFDEDECGSGR